MKPLLSLLITTMVACLSAKADDVVLEVSYDVTQRLYAEAEEPSTDQMTLFVGNQTSVFKSVLEEIRQQQRDSVAQATMSQLGLPAQGMMMGTSVQSMGNESYKVLKNIPQPGKLTLVDGVGGKCYLVTEDMPAIEWTLTEGDTTIAEYPCQKATGQWRGRTWTAWYTLDLPYNDGPWKLCGLPGLILKAEDETGDFCFDCISIKKGDGRAIDVDTKGERCTLAQLQDMKTRAAKDPVGFVLESMGLGGMVGSGNVQVITMGAGDGRPKEIPSRTPIFMEQPD